MKIAYKSNRSIDGSIKYLLSTNDQLTVESVYLPDDANNGICVSTQVGCNMGCTFCATGLQRSRRNLSYVEIFEQVSLVASDTGQNTPLAFITLSGMGEPLANYKNTMRALDCFRDRNLAPTLSLSTVGLTDQIGRMQRERRKDRLYVSLHGSDDATRQRVIPIARYYPLDDLVKEMTRYAEQDFGKVHVSYLLLPGVNDTERHRDQLRALVWGRPLVVQVLLWNAVAGMGFSRATIDTASDWVNYMWNVGVPAYVMQSKGRDIGAACGQLKGSH
ncbi:radical SAM protein [Bradyrhizobium sp. LA6.12]|uniref:radical SAM protein n=1 Tax=unclassified Bradyrhizobium TaxID=2631580 RepID=UPI003394E222